jgi:prevent-host-death family protein
MTRVTVREARAHLSRLISAAERGETIVIMRRGRQAAQLGPVPSKTRRGLPDLTAFRASLKMRGRSLTNELIAMRREARY